MLSPITFVSISFLDRREYNLLGDQHMRTLRILLLAGIPMAAWGQAVVEYGLGAAAAGTAGAGNKAGRGIGEVFSNLGKTLNSATGSQAGTAAATSGSTQSTTAKTQAKTETPKAAPTKPAVVYEDPSGIETGMEQAEVLSRFGEPAMKVASGAARESLLYESKDRSVDVEMRSGKVYSVHIKNKARQSAVVSLQ